MQYIILTIAAYALLAVETTLADGRGTFAWLLLPWLAVTLKPTPSIVAAFVFGLLLDCLSNGHPGVFVAVTVLATAGLRLAIRESALSTAPRIALTSFACSLALSLVVQSIMAWIQSQPIDLDLVAATALPSAIGAVVFAVTVAAFRCLSHRGSAESVA